MPGRAAQAARDLRAIATVGLPLILNNISSIGVNVADTLMAAHLGATQLAAVAIGSGVWIALFLLGLGVIMALGPTVAQHFGAGRHDEIGHDTRQGFWLAWLVAIVVIVIMRSVEPLLLAMDIAPAVSALAQGYLDALSWGVVGAYAYHALKQMSEGVGRTVPIMVVMGIALPLNVMLNYIFMFGRFGAEPLGAVGCGLGNGISLWLMFIMLALYTSRSRHYRGFGLRRAWERPDPRALRRLFALGLPIGLSLFLQSGLFTTVALLMGALGTVAVAAHQIVLNWSGLVFMAPLGFGMALTVCVGQAAGRGDFHSARRLGHTGMVLCAAVATISALSTLAFADSLTAIYTDDPAIGALCVTLFRIAAALQLGDGIQVAAAFALRGLKDTRVPLLLNGLNYWGVGFVTAYVLGVVLDYGASGIWIGLSLCLLTASVLLIARFRVVSGRLLTAAR